MVREVFGNGTRFVWYGGGAVGRCAAISLTAGVHDEQVNGPIDGISLCN